MVKDSDDSITSIVEAAKSADRQVRELQDEVDKQLGLGDLINYLHYKEGAAVRPFVTKAFTIIFALLVIYSIVAVIYSVSLPAAQGDTLIDRVLKVNQSIVPIVTLVIGFYFGSSWSRS